MRLNRGTIATGLLGLVLAAPLAAQSHPDSLGWHFVGTLGYVQTSGNTKVSTVNLGDKLTYRASRQWLFTQTSTWVYGRSAGAASANQLNAGLRADYSINPRLSAFMTFSYEANPFAGVSHRMNELVGLSWKALAQEKQTLSLDVGIGQTQERAGRVDADFAVARFAPTYRYNITAAAYFEEALELLENLKSTGDLRVTSQTTLVAPLSTRIGLRFGLLLKYDAEPALLPPPNPAGTRYEKLDTTFTSGLQITL